MFGYVTANLGELTPEEKTRYTQVYCGICAAIGRQEGQLSRLGLQYDMAFLALTLMSLYEPEEEKSLRRCLLHPAKGRSRTDCGIIRYTADMNVALFYRKCLDDWQDDKKQGARLLARHLEPQYSQIAKKYPRQCKAIDTGIRDLSQLEKDNVQNPDLAAAAFGRLMGELFVWQEDLWQDTLRAVGEALGRFIYLMDAELDLEEDRKKGSYNPLAELPQQDHLEQILTLTMGRCAYYYEKLPLVQDKGLLDNILYSGVWVRYREKYRKERNQ